MLRVLVAANGHSMATRVRNIHWMAREWLQSWWGNRSMRMGFVNLRVTQQTLVRYPGGEPALSRSGQ